MAASGVLIAAAPKDTPFFDPRTGRISTPWISWLNSVTSAGVVVQAGVLGYVPLNPANNLSDVSSVPAARANLGLGTAATADVSAFDAAGAAAAAEAAAIAASCQRGSNLSDVASAPTARTNLGLGTAATQASSAFDAAGTAAAAVAAIPTASASVQGLLASADWSTFNGKQAALSVTNDTNVTGSVAGATLTLAWAGTLAAARLNASVVQSVVNDTNITGAISAQALTFAWAGQLSIAKGGTGASSAGAAVVALGAAGIAVNNAFTGTTNTFSGVSAFAGAVTVTDASFSIARTTATNTALISQNSGSGHATVQLNITAANSTGNPYTDYIVGGVREWITGIERASQQYRIATGSAFSSSDYLAIAAGGHVMLGSVTDNGVDKLQVNGSVLATSLHVTAGSNTKTGSGTLAAGTVTIANTSVTANSKIFVTPTANSANSGALAVTTKTAATSFVVKSSNPLDTSTFDYFIIETS